LTVEPLTPLPAPNLHSQLEEIPTEGVGFGRRTAAYVIDYLLVLGVTYVASLLLTSIEPGLLWLVERFFHVAPYFGEQSKSIVYIVSLGVSLLYMILFEWICSATPGKLILGMRVVMEDGQPCRLGPAILRGLLLFIDGLIMGIPAYQSMRRGPENQRLGDRAAGTMVVRANQVAHPRNHLGLRTALVSIFFSIMLTLGYAGAILTAITDYRELIVDHADQINLQLEDLGSQYTLQKELGNEALSGGSRWDANQRLYRSTKLTVESCVVLFRTYAGDPDQDLINNLRDYVSEEFDPAEIAIEPPVEAELGDRGWIIRFSDPQTENVGYGILFMRKNVYVRMVFFGTPDIIEYKGAQDIAQNIDQRIVTGDYSVGPLDTIN
jgi:uncharacterized RDD family membrane protein YckC